MQNTTYHVTAIWPDKACHAAAHRTDVKGAMDVALDFYDRGLEFEVLAVDRNPATGGAVGVRSVTGLVMASFRALIEAREKEENLP